MVSLSLKDYEHDIVIIIISIWRHCVF